MLYVIIFSSILLSTDINYSLESKYGDSDEINFSEHILDVNTYLDNGLFINTQFEYSDPPLFGNSITGINGGYMDYYSDKYHLMVGDLQILYGRGLTINTFHDHTIDFDSRIKGIDFKYFLNDNLTLFTMIGNKRYDYRQTPADREANFSMQFDYIFLSGLEYMNDKLGSFHFLYMQNKVSSLGSDLNYYEFEDFSSTNNEINISWNRYFDIFEVYAEYSSIYYKMNDVFYSYNLNVDSLGVDSNGSKLYFTLNTSVYGIGITYDYKNYFHPGVVVPFSSPPIGYRESISILASRNTHNMNFQDELGHQLDINYGFNNSLNIYANLSLAYRNNKDVNQLYQSSLVDHKEANVLSFNKDNIGDMGMFRQSYLEFNGWLFSDKVYYKIGIDDFNEMGKFEVFTNAITFPAMFTINMHPDHSLNMYIEYQDQISSREIESFFATFNVNNYSSSEYLSLTYGLFSKFSFSYFYDAASAYTDFEYNKLEDLELFSGENCSSELEYSLVGSLTCRSQKVENDWIGYELGYEINSTNQLSIFYGSQKGGLVCANGICAQQPDFIDGFKVTLRSLF